MFKLVAVGSCGMYTGAALYISIVQHPSLLCVQDHEIQGRFFADMYRRATRFMAPLSVISSVSALSIWFFDKSEKLWLISGLLMASLLPYTTLAMLRLNLELCSVRSPARRSSSLLYSKLIQWGRLHAVRSVISATATTTILYTIQM
ncbi:hypothetical protein THRCLA_23088 [Thraustotheca clavata]|uniref:DUF1772 domain-containing protein n=1 Tax=Thraustotheca clavata TaxID=74557 RepID=A0A1V9YF09_9STRA|nr:hypothetical protein THRCLA_23088 [Thraustotheca clavata]